MSDDDDSEFARMLTGVKRLRNDRVNHYGQRKPARPAQKIQPRSVPAAAAEWSIPESTRDSYFHSGLQSRLQRKIRQGAIRPEAVLDLHGYRRHEAIATLEDFLADALHQQYRMLLIIHGQGYRSASEAVLKPLLHGWLAEQHQVLAWCPARASDGAGGASYVYLRNA